MDLCISLEYWLEENYKQFRPGFEFKSLIKFSRTVTIIPRAPSRVLRKNIFRRLTNWTHIELTIFLIYNINPFYELRKITLEIRGRDKKRNTYFWNVVIVFNWNHFEMRLLNLKITFYLLWAFCPHLGSFLFIFCVVSSFTTFRPNSDNNNLFLLSLRFQPNSDNNYGRQ